MSRKMSGLVALLLTALMSQMATAHCQVPCGIYDDAARVARMYEDAATIEKAMLQMQDLAGKTDAQSGNQFVRWVETKEEHASNIITIVAEYFLTQKVKPVDPLDPGYQDYLAELGDHHRVMVAAMKCKQNTDPGYVEKLRGAIEQLSTHYNLEHTH